MKLAESNIDQVSCDFQCERRKENREEKKKMGGGVWNEVLYMYQSTRMEQCRRMLKIGARLAPWCS